MIAGELMKRRARGAGEPRPRVAYLRPHETLSKYELGYAALLCDEFDLAFYTTGAAAIGGDPPGVVRLSWPDEWTAAGRRRSLLNGFYARVLGRRYHLPGLDRALSGVALVQANEAASECSWQAARAKERYGFRLLLSVSENQPILEGKSGSAVRRIRAVAEATDHAFAISRQARDRLEEIGVSGDRITLLGHGIDCDRFVPRPEQEAARRAQGTPIRVGYAGRFRREKGLGHLLAATRDLDVDILLLGDGPDAGALKASAGPRVSFAPALPYERMHEFYPGVDIFVLPSIPLPGLVEQFGFVLIEAMASGIPVVASAIGGIPDVLGDAGVLVPPGDEPALRAAIAALAADPERRRMLAESGRTRALAHYRREDVADRMRAVWRRLASS